VGIYAVGLSKGWVEIRQAVTKPVTIKSEVKRDCEIPAGCWPNGTGRTMKHTIVMSSIIHEGGKVIAVLPRARYLALMRKYEEPAVERGHVRKLSVSVGNQFLDEKWKRANGIQ